MEEKTKFVETLTYRYIIDARNSYKIERRESDFIRTDSAKKNSVHRYFSWPHKFDINGKYDIIA